MTALALKVSLATYDEIAGALERAGTKINTGDTLTIGKSDRLIPPIDFRLVTIRRDVMGICAPVYQRNKEQTNAEEFIDFVSKVFNYVLNGEPEKEEVKEITSTENE